MLTSALAFVLVGIDSSEMVLSKIQQTHATLRAGVVEIVRPTLRLTVGFKNPGEVSVVSTVPDPNAGPLVRISRSIGSTIQVYQPYTNEVFQNATKADSTLEQRANSLGYSKDEVVRMVVNPTVLGEFLKNLRNYKNWQAKGRTIFAKGKGKMGSYQAIVGYDSAYRLTKIDILEGTIKYKFDLLWRDSVQIQSIPKTARPVTSFSPAPVLPKGNKAASQTVYSVYRAYTNYGSGLVDINTAGSKYRIGFGPKGISQSGPVTEWSWNGTKFFYKKNKKGPEKSIDADARKVNLAVASLGDRIHPVTKALLEGKSMVAPYLFGLSKATLNGTIAIDGAQCKVLRLSDPNGLVITLFVRKKDNRIQAVDSENRDKRGNRVSYLQTKFSYLR